MLGVVVGLALIMAGYVLGWGSDQIAVEMRGRWAHLHPRRYFYRQQHRGRQLTARRIA
jgi:hypothetical protein